MLEWIVWAGGALFSVEGAYEQLGRTRIRNDTNITNPALKKPDWLQMKSTIQLGRNWAIHNEKAVISVFQQEANFRDASLACIHPLHTSIAHIQAGLGSECPQVLCAISVSAESHPGLWDTPFPIEGGHVHWCFPAWHFLWYITCFSAS